MIVSGLATCQDLYYTELRFVQASVSSTWGGEGRNLVVIRRWAQSVNTHAACSHVYHERAVIDFFDDPPAYRCGGPTHLPQRAWWPAWIWQSGRGGGKDCISLFLTIGVDASAFWQKTQTGRSNNLVMSEWTTRVFLPMADRLMDGRFADRLTIRQPGEWRLPRK